MSSWHVDAHIHVFYDGIVNNPCGPYAEDVIALYNTSMRDIPSSRAEDFLFKFFFKCFTHLSPHLFEVQEFPLFYSVGQLASVYP